MFDIKKDPTETCGEKSIQLLTLMLGSISKEMYSTKDAIDGRYYHSKAVFEAKELSKELFGNELSAFDLYSFIYSAIQLNFVAQIGCATKIPLNVIELLKCVKVSLPGQQK